MSDTPSPSTAEADLAFMRALVDGGKPPIPMAGPSIYLVAGLLYGLQCVYHLIELVTPIHWPGPLSLGVAVFVNLAFFTWLAIVLVRERGKRPAGPASSRALNAMFGATGLANIGFIAVLGLNAVWRNDFSFWLLYAAIVFILQGAAWWVAWLLRRRVWMALTAIGWFVSGTALGLILHRDITAYLAVCAAALFLCMALPGWIMIRQARAEREG
ncbi:MAG TPA: hypothetical protein VMG08_07910 [Allosphingosinicella sp.]|nr:hypothetical protein [Allosphingosinicella sp.]